MFNYDSLKSLAARIGKPVKNLLALSPSNDPFYAGVDARRRDAEWFAAIWAEHGGAGTHLRRLHYKLISSATPIIKPNGQPYQNTLDDWQFLGRASLSARYLDLIPFDDIVDRRNDEPMFFAADIDPDADVTVECGVDNTEPSVQVYAPSMPDLPSLELFGNKHSQKFITEVWIEKSTQNDWLVPLCRRRGVNLAVGIGEQSETRSRQLALRAARGGVPVRIIYIVDFDPGGRSMPKAVARKVEFTIAKLDLDVDLKLIPLALTAEQCREYRLPRVPIKETERRKATFENTFGEGATELDAIEALYPGELARLLSAELDNWLDPSLDARSESVHRRLLNDLGIIEEEIRSAYEVQIKRVRSAFDDIVARVNDINDELSDWQERASTLWTQIAADLEEAAPDLSEVEMPESEAPGTTERFVLFDSQRDYFSQMDAYNAWRDGDESNGGAS